MIRFDLPDNATQEEIERFVSTLEEQARAGVRQMLLDGATEDEIADYIESVDRVIADEEDAGFEEEEPSS